MTLIKDKSQSGELLVLRGVSMLNNKLTQAILGTVSTLNLMNETLKMLTQMVLSATGLSTQQSMQKLLRLVLDSCT